MYFIKNFLPSSKVNEDVSFQYNKISSLEPIMLNNFSFTSPMKKYILNSRKNNSILKIERSLKKLCLIIPYRDRKEHLDTLIPYITDYLQQQNIEFEIIVVEQNDTKVYNKAKLLNIGVIHASDDVDYFTFQDVDLLPENIDYRYCNYSLKPFTYIKKKDTVIEYAAKTFGGVILVPKNVFYDINGFSNKYKQWGSEDDDFHIRHLLKGHVTLYDTKGLLIDLGHPPTLTRDVYGNYVKDKSILKQNKLLRKKNRHTLSRLKRGIDNQDDDGVKQLIDLNIPIKTIEKKGFLLIKVSF